MNLDRHPGADLDECGRWRETGMPDCEAVSSGREMLERKLPGIVRFELTLHARRVAD